MGPGHFAKAGGTRELKGMAVRMGAGPGPSSRQEKPAVGAPTEEVADRQGGDVSRRSHVVQANLELGIEYLAGGQQRSVGAEGPRGGDLGPTERGLCAFPLG